jgi:FkbM family methyltransferase
MGFKAFRERFGVSAPVLIACALKRGYLTRFHRDHIDISRGGYTIRIARRDMWFTLDMCDHFDTYLNIVESANGVADFSRPTLHRFKSSGISFWFPAIPEEECAIQAYEKFYRPRSGDVVFDVGAHAGASSYFLSRAVGPAGRVFAFEPDPLAHEYLLKNIALHNLANVSPIHAAMAEICGTARFASEGTIGSSLARYTSPGRGKLIDVDTVTLERACEIAGAVPSFVKMDVEGAEIGIIESSREFLRSQRIRFAIDTNHRVRGSFTSGRVERAFGDCGYHAETGCESGFLTTWARPNLKL